MGLVVIAIVIVDIIIVVRFVVAAFILFACGKKKFNWGSLRLHLLLLLLLFFYVVVNNDVFIDLVLALVVITDHIILSCGQ